ncbi:type II secretion system F family protein [bacterium]|nr:type II secretion system F family protein [bacterium]
MALFTYSGFNEAGKTVSGAIEAPSEKSALDLLSDGGIIPSEIKLDTNGHGETGEAAGTVEQVLQRGRGRISMAARTLFVRELATFLHADIPLLEALGVLHQQETNSHFRAIIGDLHHRVQGGESFSSALTHYPKVFSPLLVSMVRVGETGGMLGNVMDQMANWMEHEEEVRGEVRGALAYPIMIVVLGLLTMGILTTFVLPKITTIFQGMGGNLPLPTKILMGVADFMGAHWKWVLLGMAAVCVGMYYGVRSQMGARLWDSLSLKLPLFGNLARKNAIARFARANAALLAAGVPLLESLKVVRGLLGNQVMAAIVDTTIDSVTRGQSLAHTLAQSPYFPPAVTHLLGVGERTGRLSEMFDRVAKTFERQTRGQIKVLLELLAPMMIVLLAVMVGMIALAILLPIMRINQLMK